MKKKHAVIALIFLCFPLSAMSQGYTKLNVGMSDISDSGFDNGFTWSLYGGWRFGKYFAIEAGYIDFGNSEYEYFPEIDLGADGIDAALYGILPLSDKVELFARLGFTAWEAEATAPADVVGLPVNVGVKVDGEDINYGAGLTYHWNDSVSSSLGFQSYRLEQWGESSDIRTYTLGTTFYFGGRPSLKSTARATDQTYQPVTYSESPPDLRAVSETEKTNCRYIKTISTGSGGPGDASTHADVALKKAMEKAESAGAGHYFVVDMASSDQGASLIIEALDCD